MANQARPYPTRQRGGSGNYLAGGLHFSDYQFLPSWFFKRLTLTEFGKCDLFSELLQMAENGSSAHELQWMVMDSNRRSWGGDRFERLPPEEFDRGDFRLPWFLRCNPGRYPTFFEKRPKDQRLD
jgi:hypothetical protein